MNRGTASRDNRISYSREYSRDAYVDGNTVRKVYRDTRSQAAREYDYNRRIVREVPGSARKGIKRRTTINAGYVLFITLAMCVVGSLIISAILSGILPFSQ